jgi:ParB family chromosome partitioning protein
MNVGAAFQYDKVKRGKAKGGAVYISCAGNGEIGVHEGWLDAKEAARRDKASEKSAQAGQEAEKKASAAKPERTSAAMRYIDLHRQNAVRAVLLKPPQIALRLLAASVMERVMAGTARAAGCCAPSGDCLFPSSEQGERHLQGRAHRNARVT